jgi:hypothetical protein
MSNHKWQVGQVKLANGEDAFIDAINEGQEECLYTGRTKNSSGYWSPAAWHINGRYAGNMFLEENDAMNLAPPPKKKVRVKAAFNVYPDGTFSHHYDRDQADRGAGSSRIACKEIDIEVEEGEGL